MNELPSELKVLVTFEASAESVSLAPLDACAIADPIKGRFCVASSPRPKNDGLKLMIDSRKKLAHELSRRRAERNHALIINFENKDRRKKGQSAAPTAIYSYLNPDDAKAKKQLKISESALD